ncbi:unnamed protein product [Colias eurytheme]|nr:unnamed protein product [Colias eurytheme]
MSTNTSLSEYKTEMKSFEGIYPTIIDAVCKNFGLQQNPSVAVWMKKILDYNLHGGKKARGLTTILAYETLEKQDNISVESLEIVRALGWCVEMLQAYSLIMDDIMDGSTTRRGVPCWYRLPEVGMGAINDCNLVQSAMYEVIRVYCEKLPTYKEIVHLFNETLFYASIGQHLDFTMAHRNKDDFSLFTPERYAAIVKFKTGYYTFKLPIFLGMLVANNMNSDTYKRAETICLDLGYLFQMQDDFLDCFSSEQVTGKAGTDIQEGKCSWLAIEALKRFTTTQLEVFIECYGSHDPAKVKRVKQLYEELQLRDVYQSEERQRYNAIIKMAEELPSDAGAMPELFKKLLALTYDRKK